MMRRLNFQKRFVFIEGSWSLAGRRNDRCGAQRVQTPHTPNSIVWYSTLRTLPFSHPFTIRAAIAPHPPNVSQLVVATKTKRGKEQQNECGGRGKAIVSIDPQHNVSKMSTQGEPIRGKELSGTHLTSIGRVGDWNSRHGSIPENRKTIQG